MRQATFDQVTVHDSACIVNEGFRAQAICFAPVPAGPEVGMLMSMLSFSMDGGKREKIYHSHCGGAACRCGSEIRRKQDHSDTYFHI